VRGLGDEQAWPQTILSAGQACQRVAMNGKERCRATDHRFDVRFIIACVRACVRASPSARMHCR